MSVEWLYLGQSLACSRFAINVCWVWLQTQLIQGKWIKLPRRSKCCRLIVKRRKAYLRGQHSGRVTRENKNRALMRKTASRQKKSWESWKGRNPNQMAIISSFESQESSMQERTWDQQAEDVRSWCSNVFLARSSYLFSVSWSIYRVAIKSGNKGNIIVSCIRMWYQ